MQMMSLGKSLAKAANAGAQGGAEIPAGEGLSFPSLLNEKQAALGGLKNEKSGDAPSAEPAVEQDADAKLAGLMAGMMAVVAARIEAPAQAEAKAALTAEARTAAETAVAQMAEGESGNGQPDLVRAAAVQLALAAKSAGDASGQATATAIAETAAPESEARGETASTPAAGWKLQMAKTTASDLVAPSAAKDAAKAETALDKQVETTTEAAEEAIATDRTGGRALVWQATAVAASATTGSDGTAVAATTSSALKEEVASAPEMPVASDEGAVPDGAAPGSNAAPGSPTAATSAATTAAPAAALEAHAAAERPQGQPLHGQDASASASTESHDFETATAKAAGGARPHATTFATTASTATASTGSAGSVRGQVIQQVAAQSRPIGGLETMTLQLDPEHLGQVEIRLSGQDDQLQVVITASGQDAEKLLREGVKELADGIVERSGRWQQVDVKVELKDQEQKRQERGSAEDGSQRDPQQGHGGSQGQDGRQPQHDENGAARQWAETRMGA